MSLYLKNACGILLLAVLSWQSPMILIHAADTVSDETRRELSTPATHWIWASDHTKSDTVIKAIVFEKEFQLPTPLFAPRLRCLPCFTYLSIRLDGEVVAELEPYDVVTEIELPNLLAAGPHRLSVIATPVEGPSAFFLELYESSSNRGDRILVTDRSWQAISYDRKTNHTVADLGPLELTFQVPSELRVGIDVTDNYEQWKQAIDEEPLSDAASFLVSPGFELRRVKAAGENEGSWVSMAFDPQGRLVIAKEDAGLLRVTLSADGTRALQTETLEAELKECRGLTFLNDNLYVNANNSKGLYVLRRNGDAFEAPELVHASAGGVGHGRNDLTAGPDGMLYSIHGDSVDLPLKVSDYTSPFRDARQGKKTSEGHLLRINPASGDVEILAAGLRNPFGIDFNQDGELFTYDADAEHDMGAPWYRPTRVNHLVLGGDYGWRGVTKSWPPYFPDHPDNALPNFDVGKGSPTAVKFGTRSNFPDRYRKSLFILDWAYGRVLAVHPIARGSSYVMTAETFLKGRPLNVTDLDFASDGSMYLVTGGRKTQSALYRIRFTGESTPVHGNSDWSLEREAYSRKARRLRRQLEAQLTHEVTDRELKSAWKQLQNPDPWISHAASRVIEQVPVSDWASLALRESNPKIAVRALLSLVRSEQRTHSDAAARRLLELLPELEHESEQLVAYYGIWLALKSMPKVDSDYAEALASRCLRDYPCRSLRNPFSINRLLSEILVQIGAPGTAKETIRLLSQTPRSDQRMHFLLALRHARHGWDDELRKRYLEGLNQAGEALGGAGLPEFLGRIREEFVAGLDDSQRERLRTLINPPAEAIRPSTTQTRPFVREWTVAELVDQMQGIDGNAERGAEVFSASGCIQCHRFGTRGTLIGPDLTAVRRRFNRHDLLKSILQPSQVIAENYRSVKILTQDGRSFVGQVLMGKDYRSPTLQLATNPAKPSVTLEIDKNEIVQSKESMVSWMPKGLLDSYTAKEIVDLLVYLESSP